MQSIPYFHYSIPGGPLGVGLMILGIVGVILLFRSIAIEHNLGLNAGPKISKKAFTALISGGTAMLVGLIGFGVVFAVDVKTQESELRNWANENYSLNLSEKQAADLYYHTFGRSVHDGIYVKQDGKTVRIMLKQIERNDYKLVVHK